MNSSRSLFKGVVLGILLAVFATAIAGYVIIRTGTIPANADDRPPKFERWAARTSLDATLERSAPAGEAPVAADESNLLAGVKLYAKNCSVCHGNADGNPTNIAKGLYQKPPQLGKHGVEDDPVGITYWKITHGIRWTGMPAFGKALNETQVWQADAFFEIDGSSALARG